MKAMRRSSSLAAEQRAADATPMGIASALDSLEHEPGLIEKDLRRAGTRWWQLEHRESFEVWAGASENLGIEKRDWGRHGDDIASEAIEHAATLRL